MLGPLPVEVYVDGSRLVLRHQGGDLALAILDGTCALQLRALAVPESPRAKVAPATAPAPRPDSCQAPGCGKPIEQGGSGVGRPRRYCDARCGASARKEARERTEAAERAVGRPATSRLMDRFRAQRQSGAA